MAQRAGFSLRRQQLRRWISFLHWKNNRTVWIVLDTGLSSLSNVYLLVIAATRLESQSLALFATFQFLVVTIVGVQRASVLAPGLAVQRETSRASIPVEWIIKVSLPVSLTGASILPLLATGVSALSGALIGLASTFFLLSIDVLRFHHYGRDAPHVAVFASLSAVLVLAAITLGAPQDSLFGLACTWTLSLLIAFLVALLAPRRWSFRPRKLSAREALRLGRWSGLDACLSGIAGAVPLIATTVVLSSDVAGIYRVFQSMLGPLNVLATSLMAVFGLDAWRLTDRKALLEQRRRVRTWAVALGIVSMAYTALATAALYVLAPPTSDDAPRAIVLVAVSSVLGLITSPISAGASALGLQRVGAALRIVVLAVSALLVFLAIAGLPIPWNDPIGALMVFAALVNLFVWTIAFILRSRREVQRLVEANAGSEVTR